MEYIFAAIALVILAICLLLSPVGLHLKGKLLLLGVIFIISIVGLMATTFLELWQTAGLLAVLFLLFSYFLFNRIDSLFYDSITEMEQGERIQYHRLTLPVRIKDDIEYIPINRNGQEIPPIEVEVTAPVEIEETTPYNADEVFDSKQNYDIEFHSSPDTKIVSDKEVSSPMDNPNIVEEEEIHHDSLENEQSTKLNPFDHIDQDLQLLMNRYIQEEEEIEDIFYQSHKNEFAPYSRNLESLLETDESHKADNIVMERLQLLDDDEHIIKEINLSPIEREKLEKEEESYSPFDLIEEIKEFKHPTKKEKK